jgi:hypothetical protein
MNVIASNSDTFRNRQKNLNRLKVVLVNMMKSIMYLEKENGNYNGTLEELEYDIQFDDDIMTDDATVVAQYRKDAEDGVITYEKYIMKAYGVSEEEAKEITDEAVGVNVSKINALSNAVTSGVMSIQQSQKILNPEASDDELQLAYITTLVEKAIPLTEAQLAIYNATVE